MSSLHIGEKIKKLRKSKGISGRFVAGLLDISPSTLTKWEKGERSINSKHLPALALILNCNVQDFYEEKIGDSPIKLNRKEVS
ncbi:XRE family transcriptional regulator [Paenibacillaceae bacterium]|nr:XRE family transcriptional regulator [Paenibacillaceae bacterium]